MGTYLNPGNEGFAEMRDEYYRDKTGLIALINDRINKTNKLTCISRPRRFGKSFAAKMLCAYYDHTCDSHGLFEDLEIAKAASYEKHLNKYNVIYLDMSNLLGKVAPEGLVKFIEDNVELELLSIPDANIEKGTSFDQTLIRAVEKTGRKFIMIIDEWDAPIRETPEISKEYLRFLRMLFKSSATTAKIFAAAYMTGILPIKKDGTQSAISDFREFPILNPGEFAEYTGFTEKDVRELCAEHNMDFDEMKRWYDGYSFDNVVSIYNPFSVISAIEKREVESYWKQTSIAEPLLEFIQKHLSLINGQKSELQEDIIKLIAGEHLKVNVTKFKNDFQSLRTEDDVLTLFIHLGYLVYDKTTKRVRIPNEEVRLEFHELIEEAETNELTQLTKLVSDSEKLLKATLKQDGATVADTIKRIRETNYAPTHYNNEQSLRYAVKFAYIVCVDYYLKIEELPSGKGLADIVYLPSVDSALPAMVIELKWNETAESAIGQIKKRDYPAILTDYYGEIILVGINYDSSTNEHTCVIEKHEKK